jgi:iron complex transport system permease protein
LTLVETRPGRTGAPSVAAGRLGGRGIALGVGVLLLAIAAGVLIGPVHLSPLRVAAELFDHLPFVHTRSGLSQRDAAILWQLRAPRVVLGGLVGATLALSGAAYQGVFRNPLADPYLLGAAAGAGLGATIAIAYGPHTSTWPVAPLPLAAFVGAVAGVALAYVLAGSVAGRTSTTLVLSGVAVASFLTALQTFVQQRKAETLRDVYDWILGRLTTAGWHDVVLILPYVAVSTAVIIGHRRLLDVMSVGDEETQSLGVRPAIVRLIVVAAASLGTAAAVSVSGLIGFVGIIVPHTVRLIAGSSYRVIVPLSLLFGAAFLILADVLARTVLSPAELPIGVVTAFFGAPFFAIVLRRTRGAP